MALIVWPVTLPQSFLIDDYQREGHNNVIRSAMETGPPKCRRRYTAAVQQIQTSMIMTPAQLLIFEDFYENTILDGALEFEIPDDINGGTMDVKFRDKYTANFLGTVWRVSMPLAIQP